MSEGWDYFFVGGLGALVGVGELVSRYRDEPLHAFRAVPAYLYVLLNVSSAVLGLVLIRVFEWNFGISQSADGAKLRCIQVLVAGTAAMALLRSSLFTVRVGNQDVAVGPSQFLKVFLAATDRAVDRLRALARDNVVKSLISKITFESAYETLPAHCMGLMQNLSSEEQTEVGKQIAAIRASNTSDQQKARLLLLTLLNLVGERVLCQVIANIATDKKTGK